MAKAFNSFHELATHIEKKTRNSANQIAEEMKKVVQDTIQTEVYDKYDDYVTGRPIKNRYRRTGELIKGVTVIRGRLQASVVLDGYDTEVYRNIEYTPEKGSYKKSILVQERVERPFFETALERIDANLDSYVIDTFGEYGIHVKKIR